MPTRRTILQQLAAASAALVLPKNLFSQPAKALPKVLILGDSISIGYTPIVQELLKDKATVIRPTFSDGKAENCEGTTKGVKKLTEWLGDTQWDIIHFNFGLHDIKHVDPITAKNSKDPKHPHQASPRQYKENLSAIVEQLLNTQAQLIFATTTPYPDPVGGPLRRPGMPKKYNKKAKRIMRKNNILVNDLYAFVEPQMAALQRPENVHFTKEGSRALGEKVSRVISAYL